MNRRNKQFTLIELLIVIAIIAILAGMLLPALNAARNSAHTTNCLANQKQLAVGMLQYTDSYNGHLPPQRGSTDGILNMTYVWALLYSQMVSPSVFICPTAYNLSSRHSWTKSKSLNLLSYGNKWLTSTVDSEKDIYSYPAYGINPIVGLHRTGVGLKFNGTYQSVTMTTRLSDFHQPSAKIMLADAREIENFKINRYIGFHIAHLSNDESCLSLLHNRGKAVNIAWLDGHVSTFTLTNPGNPFSVLTSKYVVAPVAQEK